MAIAGVCSSSIFHPQSIPSQEHYMTIRQVAVIGAGTMGRGIAETAAVHGLNVCVVETNVSQREAAENQVRRSVEKGILRGKIAAATADEVMQRMTWRGDLSDAADTDFVIEAVPEIESLKCELFSQLAALCRPEVILASNTSSISITRLAQATQRPAYVVGMHFFNPVPIMSPVEVVRGTHTSEATLQMTVELAERMGKRALVVQDKPGFVVNRVLMPLINEAIYALQEGVADAATIDTLMKLGCNHPMGPLQLADFVGLDVCYSILQVLHAGLGDAKFAPCPLLAEMVRAGKLGRKSGTGFYAYK